MMSQMSIGIIGGWGWIGRAVAEGMLAKGVVGARDLIISGRSTRPPDVPAGIRYISDNSQLIELSDVVIVSVRPEQFAALNCSAPGRLVVSVMAAVPTEALVQTMKTRRVIRAMPSAAVSIGKSYTPLFAGDEVNIEDLQMVRRIFDTVGRTIEVPAEAQIDYMTGLTGSGPGFVALLAATMQSHAVASGLSAELARESVRMTVEAAAELTGKGEQSAQQLVDSLKAYRGTTAAALEAMESGGFVPAIEKGLAAARLRLRSMYPGK
jgi:pyrroline-5-carboxylate reductase